MTCRVQLRIVFRLVWRCFAFRVQLQGQAIAPTFSNNTFSRYGLDSRRNVLSVHLRVSRALAREQDSFNRWPSCQQGRSLSKKKHSHWTPRYWRHDRASWIVTYRSSSFGREDVVDNVVEQYWHAIHFERLLSSCREEDSFQALHSPCTH